MPQHYDPEFKKQIVRLHLEEGRTIISLQKEYTVSKAAISKWVKQFRDECQDNPNIVARMSRQKSIKFLMNQAAAFAASSSMAG